MRLILGALLAAGMLAGVMEAQADDRSSMGDVALVSLPEAPSAVLDGAGGEGLAGQAKVIKVKDDRGIFEFRPELRVPPHQTFADKFKTYGHQIFTPGRLVGASVSTAFKMANPPTYYPREWKDGAEAIGRNFGDSICTGVTQTTARFIVGAALHEDIRYHASNEDSYLKRLVHALVFTVIDRSDDGDKRLAIANFAGAFAGGFVNMTYLPDYYATPSRATKRSFSKIGSIAGRNVFREFSPDIHHAAVKLHVPFVHENPK